TDGHGPPPFLLGAKGGSRRSPRPFFLSPRRQGRAETGATALLPFSSAPRAGRDRSHRPSSFLLGARRSSYRSPRPSNSHRKAWLVPEPAPHPEFRGATPSAKPRAPRRRETRARTSDKDPYVTPGAS